MGMGLFSLLKSNMNYSNIESNGTKFIFYVQPHVFLLMRGVCVVEVAVVRSIGIIRCYVYGVFVNANQQTNHDSDLPVLLFYPTTGVQRFHFIHIDACTAISIRVHVASKYMCTQQFKLVFRAWFCRGKNELSNMLFPFNEYRVIWYLMATLLDIWVYILKKRSHRAHTHTHMHTLTQNRIQCLLFHSLTYDLLGLLWYVFTLTQIPIRNHMNMLRHLFGRL